MKKLNEILKLMVEQAGVTDEAIKKTLENSALAIEINEDSSNKLIAHRLTMEAAKSSPELKKHFSAQALNGIDAEILNAMKELEFEDADKSEIESQESTFKKIGALSKKIKALESAKNTAAGADKKTLNEQITKLNDELRVAKESFSTEKKTLIDSFEQERVSWQMDSLLNSFNYALPKDTPAEARIAFGRSIADRSLNEKGLKITKNNGILSLQTAEGTDYFENNVKVSVNDFVQKSLANAKVLAASQSKTEQPKTFSPQSDINTNDFMSVIDSALAGKL